MKAFLKILLVHLTIAISCTNAGKSGRNLVPIDQTKSVTNNLPNNQRINQDIRRLRKELSKVMNMRKIKRDYQKQSAAEGATTLMDLLAKSGAIDSEEGKKKARITDRKKMERMVHSIAFRATNSVTSRNSRSIPLAKEEERSQKKGASLVGKSAIGRSPRSKGGKGGSGSGSGSGKGSKGGSNGGGQASGGKGGKGGLADVVEAMSGKGSKGGSGSGSGSGKGGKGGLADVVEAMSGKGSKGGSGSGSGSGKGSKGGSDGGGQTGGGKGSGSGSGKGSKGGSDGGGKPGSGKGSGSGSGSGKGSKGGSHGGGQAVGGKGPSGGKGMKRFYHTFLGACACLSYNLGSPKITYHSVGSNRLNFFKFSN